MQDNYGVDDEGNIKNDYFIEKGLRDGVLRKEGDRLIGPDGEEFYLDGTYKEPEFW